MHDALKRVIQIIQLHAKVSAVLDQFLHLNTRHLARSVDVFGLRRHVVIHGGKRFRWLTHLAAMGAQAVKRLWRGDFVHQMTIDIEQRRFVWGFMNDMCIK